MESLTREEKEQRWQEMAARVDKITDGLGNPVDEGIKETVIVLNLLELRTSASCEGHLERGVGGPWVDIEPHGIEEVKERMEKAVLAFDEARAQKRSKEQQGELYKKIFQCREAARQPLLNLAEKLEKYLTDFYQGRSLPHDRMLIVLDHSTSCRLECQGAFLQDCADLTQREGKLQEYQEEMCAFTAFLKEHYFTG